MSELPPLIAARGLVKRYGATLAVNALDLSVARGELFGLIGPDGAGKSSVMKAIAGVLTFDGGELAVFGQSLVSDAACEAAKARLGLMPQGLGQNLYADLSVEENLDFFARLRLVPPDVAAARKDKLLEMTRLARFRQRPMKNLSGGMKQKLGLVCTLIHAPELVILDEPTTGVDPVSRRDFWAILAELLAEEQMTALVSTAYMDEASRFHRVALMHAGQALAVGRPSELLAHAPGCMVTVHTEAQWPALAALRPQFAQLGALGNALQVYADGGDEAQALAAVDACLRPALAADSYQLEAGEPELEDVFIAMLRQRGERLPDSQALTAAAPARASGGEPVIEARALTRDFAEFRAVDAVSFQVQPGEIFGLLGANGAGKTTVIKMLTGILPPSSGVGRVAGVDMRGAGRAIKERIGYMSQAFSLYLDLTVSENIRLYAGIYGLNRARTQARLDWIVDMAGLHGFEDALAASLPMGLRQRLALGCALVHQPQVLFLDEPTSGVDPLGRRQFWDILFTLARRDGVALLVTTHAMSEAEHCDHLALMFAGRLVADASPAAMKRELTAQRGPLWDIRCADPAAALARLRAAGVAASAYGNRLHLFAREDELHDRVRPLLGADARCQLRPVSMEDVFVERVTALEAEKPA